MDYSSDPSCIQLEPPDAGLLGILVANDGEYVIQFVTGFNPCTKPWLVDDVRMVQVGNTYPRVGRTLVIYVGTECHEVRIVKKCATSQVHREMDGNGSFETIPPLARVSSTESDIHPSEYLDSNPNSFVTPGATQSGTPEDWRPPQLEYNRRKSSRLRPGMNIPPPPRRQRNPLPMDWQMHTRGSWRPTRDIHSYVPSQPVGYQEMRSPMIPAMDQLQNFGSPESELQYELRQWRNFMMPLPQAHGHTDKPLPRTPKTIPVSSQNKIQRLVNIYRSRTRM